MPLLDVEGNGRGSLLENMSRGGQRCFFKACRKFKNLLLKTKMFMTTGQKLNRRAED